MSARQPETPSDPNDAIDPKGSVAQFPMVRRGYDRHLVDVRVAQLVDRLNTHRQRADEAEQALGQLQLEIKEGRQLPAWFTSLGAEVRQVGEQAAIAAEQLLAEAATRAQAAIHGAETEAASRRKAAEEQASNLEQTARDTLAQAQAELARIQAEATAAAEEARAQADRDAATLDKAQEEATLAWQKVTRERVLLEAETERLTTLRQRMVEQLGQVYAPLGLTLVDTRQELEPSNRGALEAPTGQQNAPATASQQGQLEDQLPDQQERSSSCWYSPRTSWSLSAPSAPPAATAPC
jgi:cell division septum initiation protein DivIVA